jgi:carbamoyltransferase
MTAILGLSAFFHDSAAAVVVDGAIVAAAQEERFTRLKHDASFPANAIQYCLEEAGIAPDELDYVGFYEKPLVKFERLLESYMAYAPRGFLTFASAMPLWLKQKLHLPREIRRGLGGKFRRRLVFSEHHQSHAASAFFPSPYENAAILTADGVGEWATATIGAGCRNRIEILQELRFPNSPGLLYSALTAYCGFRVNSGEYKLMGLAPYGQPRYAELFLEKLIRLKDDGSFRLNMDYFAYVHSSMMTSRKFDKLLGGRPRRPGTEITERELDLAASIQRVIEIILLRMSHHAHKRTGLTRLVLAGGVALNCVANARIMNEGPFDAVWVQPAAGDAGGALGAALFIWHQLLEKERIPDSNDLQQGSRLGPGFSDAEIETALSQFGAKFVGCEDENSLCEKVATLLAQGSVVGWFQGRMEFGPRALGSRSILADPRRYDMRERLNQKVKRREPFRPFAPAVLLERVDEIFAAPKGFESPYMSFTASRRIGSSAVAAPESSGPMREANIAPNSLPAITHVDGSARVQTVDARRDARFHLLLRKFAELTGCPVLLNTSFNVRGEPLVCTPHDAYQCFLATDIDYLAIGRFLLAKSEQSPGAKKFALERLAPFAPD